jgi:pSer/pThr/pTyr-binding forkhead associated (FHA) protein
LADASGEHVASLTLSFKDRVLGKFTLRPGEMTIGRDPSCDIHIDSLAVSPVHAKLDVGADKIIIHDMDSPEGMFVNLMKTNEHELQDNDLIRLGKHTLRFDSTDDEPTETPAADGGVFYAAPVKSSSPAVNETPASSPSSAPAPASTPAPAPAEAPQQKNRLGWLQILSGIEMGKTIKLKGSLIDTSKFNLPPSLITRRGDGYHLSNLADDTSVKVNDQDIGGSTIVLQSGDKLTLGKTELQFYYQDE